MGFIRRPKGDKRPQQGIALFMVIAAMTVLSLLVTEFTYVSQLNQKMAFDGVDQVKALYLAKAGLKLSLLRLKAYSTLKSLGKNSNSSSPNASPNPSGGSSSGGFQIPASLLDKVWSFPLVFPLPTGLPGMSTSDKDQIEKFQKVTNLDGRFTALIESDSAKVNINSILPLFAAAIPSPSPGASPSPTPNPGGEPPTPTPVPTGPSPSPAAAFNPEDARKNLATYLSDILQNKFDTDQDFATEYRDLRMDDLIDAIASWADWTYESRLYTRDNPVKPKQAPFYSISELHMLPIIDDKLYDLFAPTLTASLTTGLNVNKIEENVLRALIPKITDDEVKKFFEYRDSTDQDNLFKSPDDFFNYLKTGVAYFHSSDQMITDFKNDLIKRNINIIVDETNFKITVRAQVNQATKIIEAWVTLTPSKGGTSGSPGASPVPSPSPTPAPAVGTEAPPPKADTGLKITFMRIL